MAKDIYNILASKGRNGDTELAHITKEESSILRMLGGSGTTNPLTGLSEYHKGGALDFIGHPQHHAWWWTGKGKPKSKEQKEYEQGAPEAEGGGGLDWAKSRGDRGHGNYRQDMTSAIWNSMSTDDKIDYIAMVEFGGVIPPSFDSINQFVSDQRERLQQYDPSLGVKDPTEVGFLEEEYGVGGEEYGAGADGIYGTEDDTGGYAGRAAGIAYGTAGRTYEGAGLTWEGAQQTFGESLGALQRTAKGQATATGGSTSIGMRGKIEQQKLLGEGFESAVSTRGRAEDVYDIAGRRHDIATEAYGAAGDTYSLASDRGGASYREGMYGLTSTVEQDWQDKWLSFMNLGD